MGLGVYGGVAAARRAAWMPRDASVLVCEPAGAVLALPEAVARRKAGEAVLVSFVLPPHNLAVARRVAGSVVQQTADYDSQLQVLDQIVAGTLVVDGYPISQYVAFTSADVETMRLLAMAADGVAVASWHEYEQLRGLGVPMKRIVRFAAKSPVVPAARSSEGRTIIVWAPDDSPEDLVIPALALQELHSNVVIIANRTAWHPQFRARFVALAEAVPELQKAGVVVDYTGDTGSAIALAQMGVPLAVPNSGGAVEYLEHVTTFDEWNRSSLRAATQTAMARRPPILRRDAPIDPALLFDVLDEERPKPMIGGPLVSLVCGTYNRPEMLERMLAMCEAQTYENLEIVVVNDCGEPVDDIVAKFPRARVLSSPMNLGPFKVYDFAVKNARGEYIKFFSDDDYMFPDNIASHVQAVQRCMVEIVHHDALAAIEEPDGNGGYRTTGFISMFQSTMDRNQTLLCTEIGCGTILFRKKFYMEAGGCDTPSGDGSDIELVTTTSERYDFGHLDRCLYLYSIRTDATNISFKPVDDIMAAESFKRYHDRHPAPGRPLIEQRRESYRSTIASLRNMPKPAQRIPD